MTCELNPKYYNKLWSDSFSAYFTTGEPFTDLIKESKYNKEEFYRELSWCFWYRLNRLLILCEKRKKKM
jgi:hypothetical protein